MELPLNLMLLPIRMNSSGPSIAVRVAKFISIPEQPQRTKMCMTFTSSSPEFSSITIGCWRIHHRELKVQAVLPLDFCVCFHPLPCSSLSAHLFAPLCLAPNLSSTLTS